jgi:hypothetical protein
VTDNKKPERRFEIASGDSIGERMRLTRYFRDDSVMKERAPGIQRSITKRIESSQGREIKRGGGTCQRRAIESREEGDRRRRFLFMI